MRPDVLAAIRPLYRLEWWARPCVRRSTNCRGCAGVVARDSRPEWLERYGVRVDVYRFQRQRPDVRRWPEAIGEMDTRFWRRSMIPPHLGGATRARRPCRRCSDAMPGPSGLRVRTSGCVGAAG